MKIPRPSPVAIVRLICLLGAAGLVIFLLAAKKPWEVDTAGDLRIRDYATIGEWWAAAANLALLALLGLAAPWWCRPPAAADEAPPAQKGPRWFWPLVAGAMAVTALFGAQRIGQSLWDDEVAALNRAVFGQYRHDKEGRMRLKETTWTMALWSYSKPSNHQFQTILSKVSLDLWRAVARPQGLQFTESAVRFPCYVAGILSVAAVALLLRELGFPRAGVLAAFLLALHPWHVRYAIELRGYIFTLLFGPLMIVALLRALRSGRWRWWAAFAAAQFGLLYAYPGCLYMVVIAGLSAVAALWWQNRPPGRETQLARFLVCSAVSGGVYLQLMLPCVPQLANYLKSECALGVLDQRWHRNLGAHFLTGTPWNNSDNAAAGYPELAWTAQAHPVIFTLATAAALILLTGGLVRLLRVRSAGWIAAAILFLPAPLIYLVSRARDQYLYEWYLIFALPGVLGAVALGLDGAASLAGRLHRFLTPTVALLGIALFAVLTQAPRQWLTGRPLQPMRESVLLTRPTLDPLDPRQKDIVTLGLTGMPWSYDAHMIVVSTPEELSENLRAADRTGRPLFVNYANGWAAAAGSPQVFAMVEDDVLFEKVASIQGFDPTLTAFIRRYRPGAIEGYVPP